MADPDSLKALPDGSLLFAGEEDRASTIVTDPGTTERSASFTAPPAGLAAPDDAVMPTAASGTFRISNRNSNDVPAVRATGLDTGDPYANVGNCRP